jgi:hypothetical protein
MHPAFPALASLLAAAAAYQPSPYYMHTQSTRSHPVHVVMKGKGSRGIPGKATSGRTAGGGITDKARKKFEVEDFNKKSEWTLIAEKGDLGAETGSTKAVAAGVAPQGQEYIWTLVRGLPLVEGEDPQESTVYVTDGSCRTCLFPNTQSSFEADGAGSFTMKCNLCGTKWNLDSGEVLDFLPGKGPAQFAAKLANSKKEKTPCTVLKTRISKAGRCYVRLPDGTLPITTQRKEGTINQREEIGNLPKGFGKK